MQIKYLRMLYMNNYHRFLNLPFSVKNPTILKITDNIDGQVEECAYGLSECQNRCEFGSITSCYKNTFFESILSCPYKK